MLKAIVLSLAMAAQVPVALADNFPRPDSTGVAPPAQPDSTGVAPQPQPYPTVRTTRRKQMRSPLTISIGLEYRSDDNILQLTQHDLDRFKLNPSPPRFLIHSPDDNVYIARGDLHWRARPLPRRDTRFTASVDLYHFQRNEVKNWEQYGVSFRQELTASRRHLATLELWWSRIPHYYLRQTTDLDDSYAAGQRIRRALGYAQTGTGVRYGQGLLRGRVGLSVGFERLHRDYGPYFEERDNDIDSWDFTPEVRPFARWGVAATLTYVVGVLDARGDLPSTAIRDTDISYKYRGLGASVTFPWGHARWRGRAEFGWMPENRTYTTPDKYDVMRFGRVNNRHEIDARITQGVWGRFDLIASCERLTSDAAFPPGIDITSDVSDFKQTWWGLMLRGRWDVQSR